MEQFISNNSIWLIPCVSIVLSIIIKVASKTSYITLDFLDFLDFGFGLSVTAMVMIFTNLHDENGTWLLLLFFILITSTAIIVNRLCWDKSKKQLKLLGVLIPDVVGIGLLMISIIYLGGGIQ